VTLFSSHIEEEEEITFET